MRYTITLYFGDRVTEINKVDLSDDELKSHQTSVFLGSALNLNNLDGDVLSIGSDIVKNSIITFVKEFVKETTSSNLER